MEHKDMPHTIEIEEIPIPAKIRFSSIRLNYVSPLGRVVSSKEDKKDDKSLPKQEQEHPQSPVEKKDGKSLSKQEQEHPQSPVKKKDNKSLPKQEQVHPQLPVKKKDDKSLSKQEQEHPQSPVEKKDDKSLSKQEQVHPQLPVEKKDDKSLPKQEQKHPITPHKFDSKAWLRTCKRRLRHNGGRCSDALTQLLETTKSIQFAVAPLNMPKPRDTSDMGTKGVTRPSTTELEDPPINKVAKNQKESGCSRDSSEAHETILITDSPLNGHSVCRDRPGNVTVQSSTMKRGNRVESKKRKKRGGGPSCDDIIEITSVGGRTNSRRKNRRRGGDIADIAGPTESPLGKRRKVSLDANSAVSVTIANAKVHNETIDLEADDTVTVVSDEEDVIVLGSPTVPSVRNYKAIATRKDPPPAPMSADLPSIIKRAIGRLKQTGSNYGPVAPSKSAVRPTPPVATPPVATLSSGYGGNLYNPKGSKPPLKGLRPIMIDGSNVAMSHGNGQVFSCKGIEICINYFLKRNHKVFAFLPKFRRHHMLTKDGHLLDEMVAKNYLIYTPSRYIDGQTEVPYDDRYIVQTAAELGGVIISNDNFRDLLRENETWHETIRNRLLMFTFVEDILIFPQDPLGRRGSGLEDFLKF